MLIKYINLAFIDYKFQFLWVGYGLVMGWLARPYNLSNWILGPLNLLDGSHGLNYLNGYMQGTQYVDVYNINF